MVLVKWFANLSAQLNCVPYLVDLNRVRHAMHLVDSRIMVDGQETDDWWRPSLDVVALLVAYNRSIRVVRFDVRRSYRWNLLLVFECK